MWPTPVFSQSKSCFTKTHWFPTLLCLPRCLLSKFQIYHCYYYIKETTCLNQQMNHFMFLKQVHKDSGIWSNFPSSCTYAHPCLFKLVYFMLSLLLLSMVEFLLIKYFVFSFKVPLLQCFHAYLLELFKIKAQLLKLLFIFYLFTLFRCKVLGECFFYSYNIILDYYPFLGMYLIAENDYSCFYALINLVLFQLK